MKDLEKERPNPRILLAEDDLRLRGTLVMEFREREYEVHSIGSLLELEALLVESLEFAVVDLRLGKDSGLELISRLRVRYPTCRIVVLTGYGSIPTAVEAVKRGAAQYLTKPARIEDVEKALWEDAADPERLNATPTTLAQQERDFIDSILLQCGGNISQAAKRLGIHRQSLQRKLRKFTPSG